MRLQKGSIFLLFAVMLLAGCGMNNEARDNNQAGNNNADNVGFQNVGYNNRNTNNSRMEVADEAQDRIENLPEVRRANVIVTNNNAYVAVVLQNNTKGDVRRDLENKISDQVKSTDNNINNVFVSSNPDFVDRMNGYGEKIQNGEPIEGLFEEFNEMIQRIFPNAR